MGHEDAMEADEMQPWTGTSAARRCMSSRVTSLCGWSRRGRGLLSCSTTSPARPVVIARQANIAQGPQQVNNGTMPAAEPRAGAGENEKLQNELLEAQNGERLDFGTAGAAVGADTHLAAVGESGRAKIRRR